ncbi:MAG TPA: alpha/beta hydrolase [Candidatus Binatia bacterium]
MTTASATSSLSSPIPPPPLALLPFEVRAWLELVGLVPALPALRSAPTGDGHPVLVLPGYLSDDVSTRVLRWFLRDRGYHVHGWRCGRNLGPSPEILQALGRRFLEIRERHGERISLVGWSLGGIFARELARTFPDAVRQVVTLASPFRDVSATTVGRLAAFGLGPLPTPHIAAIAERLREPLPVPTTSIFSRTDGIVAWRSCLEQPGEQRENVEVMASHCGMGHHPAALLVVADRLAQPKGTWRPFEPRGWSVVPGLRAVVR